MRCWTLPLGLTPGFVCTGHSRCCGVDLPTVSSGFSTQTLPSLSEHFQYLSLILTFSAFVWSSTWDVWCSQADLGIQKGGLWEMPPAHRSGCSPSISAPLSLEHRPAAAGDFFVPEAVTTPPQPMCSRHPLPHSVTLSLSSSLERINWGLSLGIGTRDPPTATSVPGWPSIGEAPELLLPCSSWKPLWVAAGCQA